MSSDNQLVLRLSEASRRYDLSLREIQVIHRVMKGERNSEIAAALFISEETVKTHIRHVLEKLKVHSRTLAVVRILLPDLTSSSDGDGQLATVISVA